MQLPTCVCRMKRQYAAQDIAELVGQTGLAAAAISPPSLFGLELFDNSDYESRIPAEWVPPKDTGGLPDRPQYVCMQAGRHRGTTAPKGWLSKMYNPFRHCAGLPKTPARVAMCSSAGVSYTWQPCSVVDYSSATDRYLVEPRSSAGAAATTTAPGSSGGSSGSASPDCVAALTAMQWVPRVLVCFDGEDPAVYARRFAEAHQSRNEAEAAMRYELCVDSMPTDDLPHLTTEQVRC